MEARNANRTPAETGARCVVAVVRTPCPGRRPGASGNCAEAMNILALPAHTVQRGGALRDRRGRARRSRDARRMPGGQEEWSIRSEWRRTLVRRVLRERRRIARLTRVDRPLTKRSAAW
jgi:hypothetical protein